MRDHMIPAFVSPPQLAFTRDSTDTVSIYILYECSGLSAVSFYTGPAEETQGEPTCDLSGFDGGRSESRRGWGTDRK